MTARGIEDYAAQARGFPLLTTAADLARLFASLPGEPMELLARNAYRVDLAAGLPEGTRIAFKNGWMPGLRHSAGIVCPADAQPYVVAVCYRGSLATGDAVDDPAARLLARISTRIWERQHVM